MTYSNTQPDFSTLLRTPLTERLGCRYPVIQTAMGWVADANLVIATTKAGGFAQCFLRKPRERCARGAQAIR